MDLINLIKKSIIKGYRLEARFLDECEFSENLIGIFNDRSCVTKNCFKNGVKYFLNGENKPRRINLLKPFIEYGKFLYRIRHPDLVEKTKRLRDSFEEFHETYGLRLENY